MTMGNMTIPIKQAVIDSDVAMACRFLWHWCWPRVQGLNWQSKTNSDNLPSKEIRHVLADAARSAFGQLHGLGCIAA
jgi:hypothetical protein